MNDWQAALLAAVLSGLGGALVPTLIARIPEPVPKASDELSEAEIAEGPKELYAAIAALPWLLVVSVAVSAVAGGLIGLVLGGTWLLAGLVPLVPVAVVLAIVDLRTKLLPARVVLLATAAMLVLGTAYAGLVGDWSDLVRGLIGLVVGRSFYWLLWFVRSAGMGFGDVRLAALLGFTLAFVGWAEFGVGMYAGFLLFGLPGVLLSVARRDRALLKKAFPFGPFMIGGALIGLLVGDPVVDYLVNR